MKCSEAFRRSRYCQNSLVSELQNEANIDSLKNFPSLLFDEVEAQEIHRVAEC